VSRSDDVGARLDAGALATLPVFPLPEAVLFPGALLPLHVFEPRYRDLTADVLASRRLMGIARLRPGYEADYHGRPPIYGTLGVGYVVAAEQLPDGRYHILLRGVGRVVVEAELPPDKSYRVVRSRALVDTRSSRPPGEVADRHRELVAMCDRLSLLMGERGPELRELARALPTPAACADVLAAALVRAADDRQALLEMADPAERLVAVTGHVAALLVQMTPTSGPAN
jgi:Lon protease-like protein